MVRSRLPISRKVVVLLFVCALAVFGLTVPFRAPDASAATEPSVTVLVNKGKLNDSEFLGYRPDFLDANGARRYVDRAQFWYLNLGGKKVATYCLNYGLGQGKKSEFDLSNYNAENIPNGGKIQWVLEHGYPAVGTSDLGAASGATGVDEKEALTATQAAIWHFSNNFTLTGWFDGGDKAVMTKMYNYLVDGAVDTAPTGQPLSLDPKISEGQAGTDIGPITVSTTANNASVTIANPPAGVTLVDGSGNVLGTTTNVANGQVIKVRVPANTPPGTISLNAKGTATLTRGLVIKDTLGPHQVSTTIVGQQMVLLEPTNPTPVTTTATVRWAEPPAAVPTVGTTARDGAVGAAADDQVISAAGGVVKDTVAYSGLTAGATYTVTGELMDKAQG